MYGKPLNPVRPRRISDVRLPMMKMLVADKGGALVRAIKDSEDVIRHCDNGAASAASTGPNISNGRQT